MLVLYRADDSCQTQLDLILSPSCTVKVLKEIQFFQKFGLQKKTITPKYVVLLNAKYSKCCY